MKFGAQQGPDLRGFFAFCYFASGSTIFIMNCTVQNMCRKVPAEKESSYIASLQQPRGTIFLKMWHYVNYNTATLSDNSTV